MPKNSSRIADILTKFEQQLAAEWLQEQSGLGGRQAMLLKEGELKQQCDAFLRALREALSQGAGQDVYSPSFAEMRDILERVSRSRSQQGFSPAETAMFVFSFKRVLFSKMRAEMTNNPAEFVSEFFLASDLLDKLGIFTMEAYQKSREEVINRQQQELLELSTPVVKLWDGILALPLIGTLDSNRTQTVMESLLQRIVETGAEVAIIDITGVPTVDTLVAQHLLKTVTAARLMGAECIISGIRPQIAQTIVHLGVGLGDVVTKANLADAFLLALRRAGVSLVKGRGDSATSQKV
jgi:rsbT co-antagonist protein RsbR